MVKLSMDRLRKLRLTLPPIHVQRVIVDSSVAHERINSDFSKLLRAKREFKRGLAQQLLTGQKRFPGFVLSNRRQKGEFGRVPQDWELVRIGDIASEVKNRGESEGSIVYSCTKHDGLVPSLEYFGKQVFSRNLCSYKRLSAGDFAYATNHIEEGSIGLLRPNQPPGLVSPMYTVFRCTKGVNPEFLFALLKTENYRRVFEKRTSASVDRRGSLRWAHFSRICVPLPSSKEQDRIAKTLSLLDTELVLLEAQREHYSTYKRGLLSRLLSGELPAHT
jgi:type I restriction enzyme S subunit